MAAVVKAIVSFLANELQKEDGPIRVVAIVIGVIAGVLIAMFAVVIIALALPSIIGNLILPDGISKDTVFPEDVFYETYGDYMMPCDSAVITSEYGERDNPLSPGVVENHTGIDFAATPHSYVVAVGDGTVIFTGYKNHYGRCVVVDYGDFIAYYGHLSKTYAVRDSAVHAGSVLGTTGGDPETDTLIGDSTGSHLHFETRIDGEPVNPAQFLFEYSDSDDESEQDEENKSNDKNKDEKRRSNNEIGELLCA